MKAITLTTIQPELLNNWQVLWQESTSATYINTPQWKLIIEESFGIKDFIGIFVYDKQKLVAAVPLFKQKKYGVTVYTLPPEDFVCGSPFLLNFDEEEILRLVVEKLLELGNIYLDNVPMSLVKRLSEHTDKIRAVPFTLNYFWKLQKDGNGKVSINNRKVLMRKVRKEEEKFQLKSFRGHLEEGLKVAFEIDNYSRKKSRGYSSFSDEGIKNFYRMISKYLDKNFSIHVLYMEDQPIAYEMGFSIGSTYIGSQLSFDERYAAYSPGKVMIVRLIEHLATSGIQLLDFGSGDSHIKRLLTSDHQQLAKVTLSQNPLIGIYIEKLNQSKHWSYDMIQKHVGIYRVYRQLKRIIRK